MKQQTLPLTAVVDGSSAKEFANVTAELTVSLRSVLPSPSVMGNLCQVRLLVDCEAETELEYEIMLGIGGGTNAGEDREARRGPGFSWREAGLTSKRA